MVVFVHSLHLDTAITVMHQVKDSVYSSSQNHGLVLIYGGSGQNYACAAHLFYDSDVQTCALLTFTYALDYLHHY